MYRIIITRVNFEVHGVVRFLDLSDWLICFVDNSLLLSPQKPNLRFQLFN